MSAAGVARPAAPAGMPLVASGKVREIYAAGPDQLLIVTSDRISAFDVVLGQPIPDKGAVLTALTVFWLDRLRNVVANHLLGWRAAELPTGARHLAGRAMLVRRLDMVEIECVARGYLAGSGWAEYRDSGTVCGIALPPGLRLGDRLPEPVFTPATKAATGHDENIAEALMASAIGTGLTGRLRALTLDVYRHGAEHAAARGITVADTKLEFGRAAGQIVLGDEVLTPDSSRFWPAERPPPETPPPSFDKQPVRDWLEAQPWDKRAPAPALPGQVVEATAARYRRACELLTGRLLGDWLDEAGG